MHARKKILTKRKQGNTEISEKIIQVIRKWRRNRFNTFQLLTNTNSPLLIKIKMVECFFKNKIISFFIILINDIHIIFEKKNKE